MTLGAIESFTGGLFASTIIDTSGASKYFKGCVVAYHNQIKEKLGINTANGVINKDVAIKMSVAGKEFLDVDVCVSFTGNAGPSALEDMPVGKVFIAINDECFELQLHGNRSQIRKDAVDFALEKINKIFLFDQK